MSSTLSRIHFFYQASIVGVTWGLLGWTVSPFPHGMSLATRVHKLYLFEKGNVCACVDKSLSYIHDVSLLLGCWFQVLRVLKVFIENSERFQAYKRLSGTLRVLSF